MEKLYQVIPKFNDHGSSCQGHKNYILDCEYTNKEEGTLLVKVLDNYLKKDEKVIKSVLE